MTIKAHTYPPPFGKDEDCICPDSWRKERPRNHCEKCEKAFEARRSARIRKAAPAPPPEKEQP